MDASLYILLPEGNDVLSLELTKEKLGEMMSPLITVREFARKQGINLRVFFDSDNIARFKNDAGGIVDDGSYMDKPTNMLRNFVSTYSTDVKGGSQLDVSYNYIRWDTVTCTADPDAPIVLKSAFESPGAPCVLSLGTGLPTDYYQVSIIKDSTYKDNTPVLKNVPLFFSAEECIEWLSSLLDNHFSLIGNAAFERTSMRWRKQRLFKNKEDGSYWYFDYFHKDNKIHYEVFDADGQNLGEASQDGQIIQGTAKSGRSISKILHGNP